ncbi:AraC family transcriptional regulator [Victivallis sp. Marseille-Q1083]|uniref:helix-turn-helix transcriptional regulator n=1 Tax=Victivallis sp. Marseille-Q1083 TaxID=2717288 RepID=UPI00158F5FEA|nr:AraC family transcriptional regulator [Victivallis sp. Marseille-Q1083]
MVSSYVQWKMDFLQSDSFQTPKEGDVSCKTVPYYIFAQATVGRYELSAGEEYADLAEGEAFLTGPDRPLRIIHHVNPSGGIMRVRYVHFKLTNFDVLDPLSCYWLPLRVPRPEADEIGALGSRLEALQKREATEETTVAQLALGYEVIGRILRLGRRQPAAPQLPGWLLQVLQYIYRHRFEAVELERLYALSGKSRAAFYREFTARLKLSPLQYVAKVRMQAAAQLLAREPDCRIAEVADRCGFANQFHFSRVFHRYFGCTPMEYRRIFPA